MLHFIWLSCIWLCYISFGRATFGHVIFHLAKIRLAMLHFIWPTYIWPCYISFGQATFGHVTFHLAKLHLAMLHFIWPCYISFPLLESQRSVHCTRSAIPFHTVPEIINKQMKITATLNRGGRGKRPCVIRSIVPAYSPFN
jgi:hypothetical protein